MAGRPDYLQKLKVPEGYEKVNYYSNIRHLTADGLIAKESFTRTMCTATNSAIQAAQVREEKQTLLTKPRRVGSGGARGTRTARAQAVSKPNVASKYTLELAICWKALAEIYKMHSFAPFSKLNFCLNIAEKFAIFCQKSAKISATFK